MNRDEHLLVIGMEECNEVSQRLSKALRFGITEVQATASHGVTTGAEEEFLDNKERIQKEWNELVAVMDMIGIRVYAPEDYESRRAKRLKIEKFLEFSKDQGTLS